MSGADRVEVYSTGRAPVKPGAYIVVVSEGGSQSAIRWGDAPTSAQVRREAALTIARALFWLSLAALLAVDAWTRLGGAP